MNIFESVTGKMEFLIRYLVISDSAFICSFFLDCLASEQSFSIAANFVTKIRSKLSDQSIDDLCFEKGYFANEGLSYKYVVDYSFCLMYIL